MSIYGELRGDLMEIAGNLDRKTRKKLELHVYSNILNRMEHLCEDYSECSLYMDEMAGTIKSIKEKNGELEKEDIRAMKKARRDLESFLEKKHNLVRKGKFIMKFLSIGIVLGTIVGFFAAGTMLTYGFLGALVGIGIGSKKDEIAKRDGIQI